MNSKTGFHKLSPTVKKRILLFSIIVLPLVLGLLDWVNPSRIVEITFLIEYLGTGLGILIAGVILMLDLIDRLSSQVESDYQMLVKTNKKIATDLRKAKEDLCEITNGLKQSLYLMLGFLTVCIVVGYLESLDLPKYLFYLPTPLEITVPEFLICIKYIVLTGSVVVMYLVIKCLFDLFSASSIVRTRSRL